MTQDTKQFLDNIQDVLHMRDRVPSMRGFSSQTFTPQFNATTGEVSVVMSGCEQRHLPGGTSVKFAFDNPGALKAFSSPLEKAREQLVEQMQEGGPLQGNERATHLFNQLNREITGFEHAATFLKQAPALVEAVQKAHAQAIDEQPLLDRVTQAVTGRAPSFSQTSL